MDAPVGDTQKEGHTKICYDITRESTESQVLCVRNKNLHIAFSCKPVDVVFSSHM